jgi:hypothetical protein
LCDNPAVSTPLARPAPLKWFEVESASVCLIVLSWSIE